MVINWLKDLLGVREWSMEIHHSYPLMVYEITNESSIGKDLFIEELLIERNRKTGDVRPLYVVEEARFVSSDLWSEAREINMEYDSAIRHRDITKGMLAVSKEELEEKMGVNDE